MSSLQTAIFALCSITYISADVDPSTCATEGVLRPNFLFIMMDDLGFGDISATTGQFPTPNMDALYTNAIQIKRHYVHLMCSPSRTQFLTGRYAMNLGFGEFIPWDDAEIGGIPIGQPTIANWLSQFGEYTTYGVGKWQLGYASRQLTPEAKGFNHFYGFYQGAIDYQTKTYNDIVYGDIGVYDFWEDERADYTIIDSEENTMELYSQKIQEYLSTEGVKMQTALSKGHTPRPFYLLAALQSPHVPLPVVPEFEEECHQRVITGSGTLPYKNQRKLYCQVTLLADKVVGEIINSLKSNDLYDNTLIVFTTDNGGETDRGGSNYPFRGTKGELYEGNTRVITSISGGIIEKAGLVGGVREEMVSNLDWTPTLLEFAGYLGCIEKKEYSWDGMSQYDMIMDSNGYSAETDARQSLVVNVGDRDLRSARIIVEHEGKTYKYVKSDSSSATDRWIYSGRLSDVWTQPDYDRTTKLISDTKALPSLSVIEYDEQNADLAYSQVYEDAFLFDLTTDESEFYNLLHPQLPHFDAHINAAVIAKSEALLQEFMDENRDELFSEPLDFLHERLDAGDPSKTEDGKFVRPFLTNKHYKNLVVSMIDAEGENVPSKLADLYLNTWTVPKRTIELWEMELDYQDQGEEETNSEEELKVETVSQDEEDSSEQNSEQELEVVMEQDSSSEEELEVVADETNPFIFNRKKKSFMDEQGIVFVEPVQNEEEVENLVEDELAEDIELDSHHEPRQFRLEVMLPIILAAAIILIAVCVMLLYHFVWKKRPHPTYKLIDATDVNCDVTTDLLIEDNEVGTYETF